MSAEQQSTGNDTDVLWCLDRMDDGARVVYASGIEHPLSDIRDALRREAEQGALADLSDDEAAQIDFAMSEHMYRHANSNNIGSMGCDIDCRTRGLARAVNAVLRARVAPPANPEADA